MCMSSPKPPKVERSAPPPMHVPETTDEAVSNRRNRERARARAAYGRQSTTLRGNAGGPTEQAKTLLGRSTRDDDGRRHRPRTHTPDGRHAPAATYEPSGPTTPAGAPSHAHTPSTP